MVSFCRTPLLSGEQCNHGRHRRRQRSASAGDHVRWAAPCLTLSTVGQNLCGSTWEVASINDADGELRCNWRWCDFDQRRSFRRCHQQRINVVTSCTFNVKRHFRGALPAGANRRGWGAAPCSAATSGRLGGQVRWCGFWSCVLDLQLLMNERCSRCAWCSPFSSCRVPATWGPWWRAPQQK